MKLIQQIIRFSFAITMLAFSIGIYAAKTETATFAGGCFWSMQHDFDKMPGVVKTIVGYTGGHVANPTYEQVSGGDTGHYEAIEVTFDPSKVSYEQLVNFYWHDIDPSDATGQFCDNGNEYHSVIFYQNADQQKMATESKEKLLQTHRFNKITTLIEPVKTFYPAEEYHQKYSDKNPQAYTNYRTGCRRDERSKDIWGK
jgi:peptide-methionine (S)-S-oxide reductase